MNLNVTPEDRIRNEEAIVKFVDEPLRKLSSVIDGLGFNELKAQYLDYLPVACAKNSWREAVMQSTTGKNSLRVLRQHPIDQIIEILVRNGSWGYSTGKLEQTFSLAKYLQDDHRADLSADLINDEFFLLDTRQNSNDDDSTLIADAINVWKQVYTTHRKREVGTIAPRKKRKHVESGFADWRKRRKHEVRNVVAAVATDPDRVAVLNVERQPEVGLDGWSENTPRS